MLESVRIEDFRSCGNVAIDNIGALVALVGRNSAGKTNILRAIEWGAKTATSKQPVKPDGPFAVPHAPKIELVFLLDGTRYRYMTKVHWRTQNRRLAFWRGLRLEETLSTVSAGRRWETLVKRNGSNIDLKVDNDNKQLRTDDNTPCLSMLRSFVPETDIIPHVQKVLDFLGTIRYYPLDEPNQLSSDDASHSLILHAEYLKWLAGYQGTHDPNASVAYRLLDMWHERRPVFDELTSLVGPDGLGLIDSINIQRVPMDRPEQSAQKSDSDNEEQIFYWMHFVPSTNGKSIRARFPFADLSYGTRRVLRILVSMLYDKSSVLLVEQPEDAVHPGLLHKLIPLFRDYSDGRQFIFASHSTEVFNRLRPVEIRLVTLIDGETQARALKKSEIRSAEKYMSEDGTLSDFIESIAEE